MKEIKDIIKNNTENISFFSVVIFIFYLLFIAILNIFNINKISGIWSIINYIFGFLGLCIFFLNIKNINKKVFCLIFLFMFLGFISCLLSSNKLISFLGSLYRNDGYIMYFNYIMFFYLGSNIKSDIRKKFILLFIAIVSSIILIFIKFNLFKTYYYLFYNYNHLGYYLVISTMSSLVLFVSNKKINIFYLCLFIINLTGLIINNTFGAYLGVFISFLLLIIFNLINKNNIYNIIISLLIFIILSIFISYNGNSIVFSNFNDLISDSNEVVNSYNINHNLDDDSIKNAFNRLELWTNGIKFIFKKPIFGYGIENIYSLYHLVGIGEDRPHNSLLQIALFQGVFSLIVYLLFILYILFKKYINRNNCSLLSFNLLFVVIAYFISSLFGNSMFYTTPYYLLFLGLLL